MDKIKESVGIRGRGGTWCMVCGCTSNTNQKLYSFFGLPNEPERFRTWLQKAGRMDLLDMDSGKRKHVKICSLHFENRMFLNDLKNRLHTHAVPTLLLPANVVSEITETDSSETNITDAEIVTDVVGAKINVLDVQYFPPSKPLVVSSLPDYQQPSTSRASLDFHKNISESDAAVQTSRKLSFGTSRKKKLQQKIKNQRAQLSRSVTRSECEEETVKEELVLLQKLCYKYFPKSLADVLNAQITLIGKSNKGFRYSDKFKQFVLNIYLLGPKV